MTEVDQPLQISLIIHTPPDVLAEMHRAVDGGTTRDLGAEYRAYTNEITSLLAAIVAEDLPGAHLAEIRASRHVEPPSPIGRGGAVTVDHTLIEAAVILHGLVAATDGYLAFGRIIRKVFRAVNERPIERGASGLQPLPWLTGKGVAGACLLHVAEHHRRQGKELPQFYTRRVETPAGPQETHVVGVRVGRRTYIYVVSRQGVSLEHFLLDDGRLVQLTLPDLFGLSQFLEGSDGRD